MYLQKDQDYMVDFTKLGVLTYMVVASKIVKDTDLETLRWVIGHLPFFIRN